MQKSAVGLSVLERGNTGDFFEDAVESLIGSESAERDGIGDGIVVRGALRVPEDLLSVLHTVTSYVL